LTPPRALLCKGPSDEAFFRALVAARGLPEFSIRNCADADENRRGGIDKFDRLLAAIPTYRGFWDLTDILIVADSDTDPDRKFKKVRDQIGQVVVQAAPAPTYNVPATPLARAPGNPAAITIMLVPWFDMRGNLESLCLPGASAASPAIAACARAFVECTGADGWADNTKIDKLMLRSVLSAQHPPDPFIGLGNIWKEAPGLIPLNHPCFDAISDVLESFR